MAAMSLSERWRHLGDTRLQRIVMMTIGIILVVISPIIAPLPGPWSIALFAAGFGMMLKASVWVKKRFVRFKKSYPKSGAWVDWGLRRPSYLRRRALAEGPGGGEGEGAGEGRGERVQLAKAEPPPAQPQPVDHDRECHR